MNKKRDSNHRLISFRGQITIFMILGLVILTVFLFLLFIVNSLQKANLQAEQEQAFGKLYPKEGLKLFLDDCLRDSLQGALEAIGKQGRLWRDLNPGGFIPFEEGKTGTFDADGTPVMYGLTHTPFPTAPQAYPCLTEENDPSFCQYSFPNTLLKFGTLALTPQVLEEDLRRYLQAETISCAQSFATSEISESAIAEVVDPSFTVHLQRGGVAVDATIPFHLSLHGVNYFTESSFDFFYETPLRQVVETAAYFPLQADRDYLDFDYQELTLLTGQDEIASETDLKSFFGGNPCVLETHPLKDFFRCTMKISPNYPSLGVQMEPTILENGDTIYMFSSDTVRYTVARQNRPPALDYLGRLACPAANYDYLVLDRCKDGDASCVGDNDLATVDLTLSAIDPDDDSDVIIPTLSFEQSNIADFTSIDPAINEDTTNPGHFLVSKGKLQPDFYVLKASASDGDLSDWQDVRILVEKPITTTLTVAHRYNDLPQESGGFALVSPEDLIDVTVELPERSLTTGFEAISFNFITAAKEIVMSNLFPDRNTQPVTSDYPSYLYTFPYRYPSSTIDVSSITNPTQFEYSPFVDVDVNKAGQLKLDFDINYCGYNSQSSSSTVPVVVQQCLPHRNKINPFPYPNEYMLDESPQDGFPDRDVDGNLKRKLNADPFFANHTCCLGNPDDPVNWRLARAEEEVICFQDKINEEGCFGESDAGGPDGGGYLLEQRTLETVFCSGTRGNTCEGDPVYQADSLDRCGSPSDSNTCSKVASKCAGLKPWSSGSGYWCDGPVGCGEKKIACDTAIVTNVKGLGFVNIQSGTNYDCSCANDGDNKFGDGEANIGNDCFDLATNKEGTCQKKGPWYSKEYSCEVTT